MMFSLSFCFSSIPLCSVSLPPLLFVFSASYFLCFVVVSRKQLVSAPRPWGRQVFTQEEIGEDHDDPGKESDSDLATDDGSTGTASRRAEKDHDKLIANTKEKKGKKRARDDDKDGDDKKVSEV